MNWICFDGDDFDEIGGIIIIVKFIYASSVLKS